MIKKEKQMPPKHLYCAKCGYEVFWTRRAISKMGIIIDLVDPHVCKDEVTLPAILMSGPRYIGMLFLALTFSPYP